MVVRVLAEDLVLFRDGRGRPGLVVALRPSRHDPLLRPRGGGRHRCCYHGWLFDVEGRCLEQPWEPGDGTQRERMRQPWYPVQERYGLLFRVPGASGPADPPAVGRSRLTV
jgi:phenylpropionate dioxygenase-like ring-hydroxylating dioxygenase large terminal subunit